MRIATPVEKPLFCWCGEYWIKLTEWQSDTLPEILCALYNAII